MSQEIVPQAFESQEFGTIRALRGMGAQGVDDVDHDELTEVLQRHETTGDGVGVVDPVPEWRVTWTTDGGTWHERGFYTFEKTQAFARALYVEHGPEMGFCLSASRMMTVNTHSLLHAKSAGAVELAPHLLATADTFA